MVVVVVVVVVNHYNMDTMKLNFYSVILFMN